MRINAKWHEAINLEKGGRNESIIYKINLENIPTTSGCYVFFNEYGDSYSILYIGKADNIRKRLEQQFNNVKLMMGIKNSIKGHKKVIFCPIKTMQGQRQKKVLTVLENNLIKHALAEGHNLINIMGTRIQYDEIHLKGNKISQKMFGRKINIKK